MCMSTFDSLPEEVFEPSCPRGCGSTRAARRGDGLRRFPAGHSSVDRFALLAQLIFVWLIMRAQALQRQQGSSLPGCCGLGLSRTNPWTAQEFVGVEPGAPGGQVGDGPWRGVRPEPA